MFFTLKNNILKKYYNFAVLIIIDGMNRIKEVLKEKGIKQKWLAEQLGKSYNIINGYVQNRQQPRLEILNNIANILDVDVKELIKSNKE
jgi:transcriptional regulator with XRE-family HTH domain